jgi:Na+/melibiose symporter-like transporter
VILWFKEKPPTPASPGSEAQTLSYTKGIKLLFKNKKFLVLLFAFGTIMGAFTVFGSLLDNILDCYGYSTDEVSYIAATMMVTGIISAAVFGLYIEKTLKYYVVFKLLAIIGVLQSVGFPLMLRF